MPKKSGPTRKPSEPTKPFLVRSPSEASRGEDSATFPTISNDAVLSFLKETRGLLSWQAHELAGSLDINRRAAERVIVLLRAQGYVQPEQGTDKWVTTPSGETVSGSKLPRFLPQKVKLEVRALEKAIAESNKNRAAAYKIIRAVAFGDFLKDHARVQAADVGIELSGGDEDDLRSAHEVESERAFLRGLRGRSALVNLRPYAGWMSKRSHLDLLKSPTWPASTAPYKSIHARDSNR